MSPIVFQPALDALLAARQQQPLTVLAGANNSGKTLILKNIKRTLGRSAYLIGANRFYHVYHFQSALRDPSDLDQFENQFVQQFLQEQYNYEQNFLDLQRVIVNMSDAERNALFELCGRLLGSSLAMRKVQEDNDLSPRYIDMDGQNVSRGSTGVRLLLTILGICMDTRLSTVLIDEPELGLGPRIQEAVSKFFQDVDLRREYFRTFSTCSWRLTPIFS
jgi:predicted ATP-dependent endonuclease of OLD family